MHACRKELLAKIWACDRIKRCFNAHARNADLQVWVQDVFTLTEVGDDGFVEDLLDFHDDVEEYRLIQDMRPGAANIRLAPAYSSLLHSAAKTETGSPVLVEVIMEAGATLDAIILQEGQKIYWCSKDVRGNSPLHIVATLGDRSLPVAVQLVEHSVHKTHFLNFENEVGATALDVAIENALSASLTHSETFNSMIEWLFAIGGKSLYYGDQAAVDSLLSDIDAGRRRALEAADARESRRSEAERRKLQRNQAYQLELIRASEANRQQNAAKEKAQAKKEALAKAKLKKQEERKAKIAAQLAREKQRVIHQRQVERDAAREEKRKALRKKHELKAEETQAILDGVRKGTESRASANPLESKPIETQGINYGGKEKNRNAVLSEAPDSQDNTAVLLGRALLIKMKIEMQLEEKGWYYEDASGNVQGPFDGDAMASWYSAGYLSSSLLISSSKDGEFYSLAAVMEGSTDPVVAFREVLDLSDLTELRAQLANLL
jgi:hypothetical protein